jgi:hypothetical protein
MPGASLYLASPCYGGVAQARYMRALLALRIACARQGVVLQLDLGGGEALVSRARAGMMARFLESEATHLLFVDSETAFSPEEVFALVETGRDMAGYSLADRSGELDPALLLISRAAAQRLSEAFPGLHAGLGDVRNAGVGRAAMVFDALVIPGGAYVADFAALMHRWLELGGEVSLSARTTAPATRLDDVQRPPPGNA